MRPDAAVYPIIYDERKNRATGVRIDAKTTVSEYHARISWLRRR
jgi:hypothetical protein